jgi:hypothetical protein
MYRICLLILYSFLTLGITAQSTEKIEPFYIKSIQFQGSSQQAQLPIVKLGETISLSFDDLRGIEADFYYQVTHHNYDWTPSDLSKGEYLDGFDDVRIEQYLNSLNSLQLYSHYEVRFPNRETRGFKKSGNYMIHLYDDDGALVFTRKFMIIQEQVGVGVSVKRSRDLKYINQKQAVQFTIYSNDLLLINPNESVKTVLIQNNNLNRVINDLKPQYTMGRDLIYRYDQQASFWGGNEFLNFDSKEPRVANVGIRRVELNEVFEHYLYTQNPRVERPYTFNPDINGNFVVRALQANDSRIEAEYILTHFSLRYQPEDNERVFIYGNFNNYATQDTNELYFNPDSGLMETILYLKQGFYNYTFASQIGDDAIDLGRINGNNWETENQYDVLVYYKGPGERFDRLIGRGQGNSTTITNN